MVAKPKQRQLQLVFAEPRAPETSTRKLLREIDRLVDWRPIREAAAGYFSKRGRPSHDPVVMVKMMLVGYLFGIGSDRALVEECSDRLSFREFLGYGLAESLPVHSSFTEWRHRLGSEFFREALHEIVRQCEAAGMEISGARTVDATHVKAQADKQGPTVEVPRGVDVDEFLELRSAGVVTALPTGKTVPVNTHDPDARLQRKKYGVAEFRFNASFCADVESGLITDATATGYESAATAVDHVEHDPFEVTELVADALYDEAASLAALRERGVTTYVPDRKRNSTGLLGSGRFIYDARCNEYVCPAGKPLRWYRYRPERHLHYYIARKSDCDGCPWKPECTGAARRTVTRVDHAEGLERCVRGGIRYRYLMTRRRVHEHLNNIGKRDHCLRRARALGLDGMRIQAALTAIAIDLKKLLRWAKRTRAKAGVLALGLSASAVSAFRGLRRALQDLRGTLRRATGPPRDRRAACALSDPARACRPPASAHPP